MFDNQTLNQLRGVMKEVIHEEVPGIVWGAIDSLMEHQILPEFDSIHSQFASIHREIAWIKNRMVTKDFLEERLEKFRVDLGLKYRATR